jgi:hypothetical protein
MAKSRVKAKSTNLIIAMLVLFVIAAGWMTINTLSDISYTSPSIVLSTSTQAITATPAKIIVSKATTNTPPEPTTATRSTTFASWEDWDKPAVPRPEIVDFEKQEGVVIASTIHGYPAEYGLVNQALCLLTKAYNDRMEYDVIVFTTIPVSDEAVEMWRASVYPANFRVITDEDTLLEKIDKLTEHQQNVLLERCDLNTTDQFVWGIRCRDHKSLMPLAYTWMSEWRSKQIWSVPELKPYKYMLWMDADGFCTETWKQDPVAAMIRNDLLLLFDNWPQGSNNVPELHEKIHTAYGKDVCSLKIEDGHFISDVREKCEGSARLGLVHGFFHITNLDFYRSESGLAWANSLIGDTKFRRQWDDQIAVTVPPAVVNPERAWWMGKKGIDLMVYHNGNIDGWRGKVGGFKKYFRENGEAKFPEAFGICKITHGS